MRVGTSRHWKRLPLTPGLSPARGEGRKSVVARLSSIPFVFVAAKPVEQPNGEAQRVGATNNESERTLRAPAEARKTGRTNKTLSGARRQTILTSVLQSLRLYLPTFTLTTVLAEVQRWIEQGRSCFTKQLKKLKLQTPEHSVLDRVLPQPSG